MLNKINIRSKIAFTLWGICLALSIVVGSKINMQEEPYITGLNIIDVCVIIILTIILTYSINIFNLILNKYEANRKQYSNKKVKFAVYFLLLCISWSFYFLLLYPGILTADSYSSVWQALGIWGLTNHHPVLFTFFVKLFLKIGISFGDIRLGVFFFSIAQIIVIALILSYSICWMQKKEWGRILVYGSLIFYAFNPVIAILAITMWKDIMFGAFILLLCLYLYDIADSNGEKLEEKGYLIKGFLIFSLNAFFRNNAKYAIILIFLFLLFYYKRYKKYTIILALITLSFCSAIQGPVYKKYGIKQPDLVESLSIPLQQMMYSLKFSDSFSIDGVEYLDSVLPIEDIKEKFIPGRVGEITYAEGVDRIFITEHKDEFFKIYMKNMIPNFKSYVNAYILATRGFWRIEKQTYIFASESSVNNLGIETAKFSDSVISIKTTKFLDSVTGRNIKDQYFSIIKKMIGVVPIYNVGFMVWIIMTFVVLCCVRHDPVFIMTLPLLGLWLSYMAATPLDNCFRYVYSFHLSLPLLIGSSLYMKKQNNI